MAETLTTEQLSNKAVIVGVYPQGGEDECHRSLDELCRLADTAGCEVIGRFTQQRPAPDARTCIGSGKLVDLREICLSNEAGLVIFDCELSPSQIRNIEDELGGADVIDRSMLILDIFAQHATTSEGKLQVDLAQLKYTAPRLIGKGKEMSRLGAGIRTRGPGESKLELDRRRIREKIGALEEELERLDKTRKTMRAARDRSGIAKVAIVGYTNAGKSTLLNRLTDAGILAEDKLFATLDPTTRKYALPSGTEILLTDTVGFIRRLPHHLIRAFRSTLDEAVYADAILVVADASDAEFGEHLTVTEELLTELGAANKPTLYVFNKCDAANGTDAWSVRRGDAARNCVWISARTGEGLDILIDELEKLIRAGKTKETFFFPHGAQKMQNVLYQNGEVLGAEYEAEGVRVEAIVDAKTKGMLRSYIPGFTEKNEEEEW